MLFPIFSNGQPVFGVPHNFQRPKINLNFPDRSKRINRPQAAEVCGNGIDDDGNGLIDEKDFTCYYSANGTDGCTPSKIIWGVSGTDLGSGFDLYWGDAETGKVHRVGRLDSYAADVTWASNGKLYTTDASYIYEVDPYTAITTIAFERLDYFKGNSLTSDNEGNLYFFGGPIVNQGEWYGILKLNIADSQITKVAQLNTLGLEPAGDLAFLNGGLYMSCPGKTMALINTATGAVKTFTLQNSTVDGSYGLITLGDGYLYQCDRDKIYQIDPSTMIVSSTPFFDFHTDSMILLGLSNYTEHCNAPECKAQLHIDVLSAAPFCSSTGVQLNANGIGIRGNTVYEWTFPDKSIDSQKLIKAILPGTYYIQYSGVTDFCAVKDSIFLDIKPSPEVDLGDDKFLCDGATLELVPRASPANVNFTWNNGSTDSQLVVTSPGEYILNVSNVCGTASDSIVITRSTVPQVNIGNDTSICAGTGVWLNNNNNRQPHQYTWSDSSVGDSLKVVAAGWYWLESGNTCGVSRDSILISYRDSCTCFPVYPKVDLGPDVKACDYETVALNNLLHQGDFQYKWSTGSTEQKINVRGAGVYWVDVYTQCGTIRDSIVVIAKTQGCDRDILIPSAFTPNNDGKNDLFKPVVFGTPEKYEFAIYNRWGQLIFYTQNIKQAWDGTFRGKRQNADIFVWTCSYQFQGLNQVLKKGTVALIK